MYFGHTEKRTFLPSLIGALVCLFFVRSGFLSLFFLVPMGVLAFRYDYRVAWTGLGIAVLGNTVLALGIAAALGNSAVGIFWDLLYFTIMVSIFTWISSPPPGLSLNVSGEVRLIIGSCLGALLFTGIFFRIIAKPEFAEYIAALSNSLLSLHLASGSDVVQKALLESLTPDVILNLIKSIMLRGGSLISCVCLFFFCRQISSILARFSLRQRRARSPEVNPMMVFYVHPQVIWVLSGSLLLVVLVRTLKLETPEIILWNILILCAILYFAQGLGILQFFVTRPSMHPFLRLFLYILFIVLLFSPVINAILLAGVVLLGIAENWVPFRASKQNGPPSTPEAGDGGN